MTRRGPTKRLLVLLPLVAAALLYASASGAIVNGQADGDLHPNVGQMTFGSGANAHSCSGSLIAPQVFLTAAHCTALAASLGIAKVSVSFDSQVTPSSKVIQGTYVTDPDYNDYSGAGGNSDPHDLAVVLLDRPVRGVTPAQLPPARILDSYPNLSNQTFTAVGYGATHDSSTSGSKSVSSGGGTRRYASQSFQSLQQVFLTLTENPSKDSGGACNGDSGGPHFLGGTASNLEVSITIEGDTYCRSTDKTYRLDTASARGFLGQYVSLAS